MRSAPGKLASSSPLNWSLTLSCPLLVPARAFRSTRRVGDSVRKPLRVLLDLGYYEQQQYQLGGERDHRCSH
jgi:hypothetical protein